MVAVALMEPMLPAAGNRLLEDQAFALATQASRLAAELHPQVRRALGDLVRSMNCYYSNLIEDHQMHPRDIERALTGDFSQDLRKRDLQLEARAHIEVQQLIDNDESGRDVTTADYLCWLHRAFCERLPETLLWVSNPDSGAQVRIDPGVLRTGEVSVGRHIPPSATALPQFLARFHQAYAPTQLSRLQQIIAVAAAHHRLLWIHPFYDGNGRVARLLAHAMFRQSGIGSSLWSVARGLARRVDDYKARLQAADSLRAGDLDGRGSLSERQLVAFCAFFLEVCSDQVTFMASLLEPGELRRRIELYAQDETAAGRLPKGSAVLLREALLTGVFERGQAAALTGYGERQARSVLQVLLKQGLLRSDSPKGPVRLGFPLVAVERWLPRLYP